MAASAPALEGLIVDYRPRTEGVSATLSDLTGDPPTEPGVITVWQGLIESRVQGGPAECVFAYRPHVSHGMFVAVRDPEGNWEVDKGIAYVDSYGLTAALQPLTGLAAFRDYR